jgi:hypothetical protein
MRFSITIPQIFYDMIARVIPGVVALWIARLYAPSFGGSVFFTSGGTGALAALGRGAQYLIACYLLGWILHGLTWSSREPTHVTQEPLPDTEVQAGTADEAKERPTPEPSERSQYQWIRLAHSEAGFRLVKLRAEARMLEAVRTALFLGCFTGLLLLVLNWAGVTCVEASGAQLLATAVVALALAIVIQARLENHAWRNYRGNITRIYQLLHDENDPPLRQGP